MAKSEVCCVICKQYHPEEDMQNLALLPSNLIHNYKDWFGKDLEVEVSAENSKAVVCYNCAVRYSGTQHTTQLDIMSNWWSKLPIKDDLLSMLLLHGRKLSYLMRFAGSIKLHEESVAEHSYWVSMLSLAIYKKYFNDVDVNVEDLLITAMFHDWSEIITSDVITPLKSQIKKLYDEIEDNIVKGLERKSGIKNLGQLMNDFNNMSTLAGTIVAFSDKLSCYLYVREEAQLGNQNFRSLLTKVENELFELIVKMNIDTSYVARFEVAIDDIRSITGG